MIILTFEKPRAEYLLDCLKTGKPIHSQYPSGWLLHDMLTLAGACHFASLSHGPLPYECINWSAVQPERGEAVETSFHLDLRAAIEFYSELTGLVQDGLYDAEYEPHVRALVKIEDGELRVMAATGRKVSKPRDQP